ncbi:ADAM 17-like protease [Taenia solium]|eukprot:TsM_000267500 transcript=TsM_000267500 gene=TsM_000267500
MECSSSSVTPNVSSPLEYLRAQLVENGKYILRRTRRNLGNKRICGLHIIIGYDFLSHYAMFDPTRALDHAVTIDSDPSKSIAFGSKDEMLTPQAYLQELARRPDHGPHCLSHKLCWFSSRDGILALTYVCTAYKGRQLGGICAKRYFNIPPPAAIRGNTNTGFTSYLNTNGMPVPALSAELVMAHELGHSYGSLHDPDTPLCSPENERGGVYLLNKYAVSGMMPNHYKFSPCSLDRMNTCIFNFGHCFLPDTPGEKLCGNLRLDENEECDPGGAGPQTWDPCCRCNCRLRPGAQCSPMNHACCTSDCKIKPANVSCAKPTIATPCLDEGFCTGNSSMCPGPRKLSNKKCYQHGICLKGRCIDFCTRIGLKPCQCDDPYSCKVCCLLKLAVDPTWRYASGNFSTVCRPILVVVGHNASQALEFGNFSAPHQKDLIIPLTRVEMRANFGAYADVVKELHYAIASNEVVNSPNPKGLSVLFLDDVTPCPNGRCKRGKCFKLIGPKDASFGGIVDLLGGEFLCKQANDENLVQTRRRITNASISKIQNLRRRSKFRSSRGTEIQDTAASIKDTDNV